MPKKKNYEIDNIELINKLLINNYEENYTIARSIKRDVKILIGPTNSGKTYHAIKELMMAKSGVYLAPLRLLAMEIFDKLNQSGVPCNLITGEEKIIIEGAKHTASTIEMMDEQNLVDVAVIDEFQMMLDPQRGWAWTAAIVGVPAKNIYMVGSNQALENAKFLIAACKENVEIIKKDRLNKLEVLKNAVALEELKTGDALIAFSRKDVLTYSTLLRGKGFKISILYGSLSPEVRREQARLFSSGETDILVSTDVIGMGLNLPIKRVIFSRLKKFDGHKVRGLFKSEISQIAGRAGRYELCNIGEVSVLSQKGRDKCLEKIKEALSDFETIELSKIYIKPTVKQLKNIAVEFNQNILKKTIFIFKRIKTNGIYQTTSLDNFVSIFNEINDVIKDLSFEEQYYFSSAPVNISADFEIDYYKMLLRKVVKGKRISYERVEVKTLKEAENECRKISIFLWLSLTFKNVNATNIDSEKLRLDEFINEHLVKEKSYLFSQIISPKPISFLY